VKQLLAKNAKVYLAARSAEKAANAINGLEEATKKRAIFIPLDLADLHSVRRAAEAFLAQEKRLDILFNNGYDSQFSTSRNTDVVLRGVMSCPYAHATKPRPAYVSVTHLNQLPFYTCTEFGTNVIGHYFLTKLLVRAFFIVTSQKLKDLVRRSLPSPHPTTRPRSPLAS
jgi:NAD(P)-dependent dehydrogenase (short-subunit alcohol dehydrogenase family)